MACLQHHMWVRLHTNSNISYHHQLNRDGRGVKASSYIRSESYSSKQSSCPSSVFQFLDAANDLKRGGLIYFHHYNHTVPSVAFISSAVLPSYGKRPCVSRGLR